MAAMLVYFIAEAVLLVITIGCVTYKVRADHDLIERLKASKSAH